MKAREIALTSPDGNPDHSMPLTPTTRPIVRRLLTEGWQATSVYVVDRTHGRHPKVLHSRPITPARQVHAFTAGQRVRNVRSGQLGTVTRVVVSGWAANVDMIHVRYDGDDSDMSGVPSAFEHAPRRYAEDPIPLGIRTTEFILDRAGLIDHVVAGGRVHVRVEWTLVADGVRESASVYEMAPNEQRELFVWLGF